MKRSFLSAIALSCMAWLGVAFEQGCGSPLVGLECKSGYTRCGDECFDLRSDEANCGGCGMQCAAGQMCISEMCTYDYDGSTFGDGGGDGGPGDGGMDGMAGDGGPGDGGMDGTTGDGGPGDDGGGNIPDASWPDVDLPPLCMGPGSPIECVCDLGQIICDQTCIDANTDVEHCGSCDNDCTALPITEPNQYFCVNGECVLNCVPPLTKCSNTTCFDLSNDPQNCGTCGRVCESGLCENGECLDATAAHVIAIGHDMSSALPAMRRLAGNAMFLPPRQTVRGVVYRQFSTALQTAGVLAAIAEMQAATGRVFEQVADNPDLDSIPFLLSQVDVLVIAAQGNATADDIARIATRWPVALTTFMQRGGVVVLFEGGGTGVATHQVLASSGILQIDDLMPIPNRTVYLEATNDVVASSVSRMYQAQMSSFAFVTTVPGVVVVRDAVLDLPVVIHISR